MSLFAQLHALSTTTTLFASVEELLNWDLETVMPSDAMPWSALQIEMIGALTHKHRISPSFAKCLNQLIDIETGELRDSSLSPMHIAAVREWRRDYQQAVKLSPRFVKEWAKTTTTSSHAWKSAKHHNDFREFAPHLEKVVALCRQKADLLGFQEHPYDALLDLYEPNMKISILGPLFTQLKYDLTPLLKEILTQPSTPLDCLHRHCPKHKQKAFAYLLLKAMGFHEGSFRFDLSVHPFCVSLSPHDIRMTSRIHVDQPFSHISAVLHEGGHGLYALNRPKEFFGSPLAESLSLGIDESQSRFWETIVGQSLPFWSHFFPLLQKECPESFSDVRVDDLYRAINHVTPSLIRTEADEVTYNLHIIARFEIEKALIEGSLKVKDLPSAWNDKMRESLGIAPQFDGEGCLQDVHWSIGAIGYFPTYALGNLYAAQFFQALVLKFPDWGSRLARGDLSFIREWLKENIHQHGRRYPAGELCEQVTGSPLKPSAFIHYLNSKYRALYSLSK